MSDCLLLADCERGKYDPDDVMRIFSQIPGITNLERGEGGGRGSKVIDVDYTYGAETTHAELLWTYGALSIEDLSNAGFMLAVEFSKRYASTYGGCLELFNEHYDFHQRLDEDTTLQSLREMIEKEPFAAE